SGMTTALPRFRTTPPPSRAGREAASRRKSRWLVAPSAAPSAAGCWWVISAPIAVCTVTGMPISAHPTRTETSRPGSRWRRHHDAVFAGRGGDAVHDEPQVPGGENVGERSPKRGEAAIRSRRVSEEGGVDFVGALRDRDGLETAQIRLTILGHGCSGTEYSLSFKVIWPNEKLDCSASMTRRASSESHMRVSAFSAKMPRPLGIIGRTTIAFHFFPATPSRSWPTTCTSTGLQS